jgi:hypothetical protein
MEQEKTIIVMRNKKRSRTIRFDVGEEEALISSLVGNKLRQAEAPVDVAREFYTGLEDKEWERDEIAEAALKSGFQRTEPA